VPLLIEVAAQIDAGTLDPLRDHRRDAPRRRRADLQHLRPALPVRDLAVLAAAASDAAAASAAARVGLEPCARAVERSGS
jgi:beta-lactamase class A